MIWRQKTNGKHFKLSVRFKGLILAYGETLSSWGFAVGKRRQDPLEFTDNLKWDVVLNAVRFLMKN